MEPAPATLASVVRRSCEIVDPDDSDPIVGEFEQRFEDADEPVTAALGGLESRLADVLQELDPAINSGTLSMLAAITLYLARRRDEIGADDATVLRLAARAEWSGTPPQVVRDWLDARGVKY